MFANLKITNKYREDGGSWEVKDSVPPHVAKCLAECQTEEPEGDWHFQSRGTASSGWHRISEPDQKILEKRGVKNANQRSNSAR